MKHLRYSHERVFSLAEVAYSWLYRAGRRLCEDFSTGRLAGTRWPRFLSVAIVVIALVAEFIMLWMLAELVDLCISLMELWAELAAKHLEIQLDHT